MNLKKILMLGDIVGSYGVIAIKKYLPYLIEKYNPDIIIANGENVSDPKMNGIQDYEARLLFDLGIDCITLGNHAFKQLSILKMINDHRIVVPFNIGNTKYGSFSVIIKDNIRYGIISCLGNTSMPLAYDNPFIVIKDIIKQLKIKSDIIIIEMHAALGCEKETMAVYLDGMVTTVVGTHTHTPTNDARIFKGGTSFQTDLGMCGNYYLIGGKGKFKALRYLHFQGAEFYEQRINNNSVAGVIITVNTNIRNHLNICKTVNIKSITLGIQN